LNDGAELCDRKLLLVMLIWLNENSLAKSGASSCSLVHSIEQLSM